jgi:hypothetical protein
VSNYTKKIDNEDKLISAAKKGNTMKAKTMKQVRKIKLLDTGNQQHLDHLVLLTKEAPDRNIRLAALGKLSPLFHIEHITSIIEETPFKGLRRAAIKAINPFASPGLRDGMAEQYERKEAKRPKRKVLRPGEKSVMQMLSEIKL